MNRLFWFGFIGLLMTIILLALSACEPMTQIDLTDYAKAPRNSYGEYVEFVKKEKL